MPAQEVKGLVNGNPKTVGFFDSGISAVLSGMAKTNPDPSPSTIDIASDLARGRTLSG